MANLSPAPILGGYDKSLPDVRLIERSGLALVSLAIPLGGEAAATQAIRAAFGLDLPAPGMSAAGKAHRLIRTGPDQALLMFDNNTANAQPAVRAALNGACYTTMQTDAWVVLAVSGPGTRRALERICPLDLHDSAFAVDAAGRTVMEHMSALILREGDDSFLLLSASSSARSFLHAVETSITHTS
ncbi:MAG: sarcosine oxidase subunit gamma [Rhodobacter sp.]|nr:sarcosine oxidase subunit gamma [Rhodobacter sp.]